MAISSLSEFIREHYEIHEWKHATAILEKDFPDQWRDIIEVLTSFRLRKSYIDIPGGNKSLVADVLDRAFLARGWKEKDFQTKVVVDKYEMNSPTHKVDCYKKRIALSDELQRIFDGLGRGKSYEQATTHMSKLLSKLEGGSGGGCPVLVFGIKAALYLPGD